MSNITVLLFLPLFLAVVQGPDDAVAGGEGKAVKGLH